MCSIVPQMVISISYLYGTEDVNTRKHNTFLTAITGRLAKLYNCWKHCWVAISQWWIQDGAFEANAPPSPPTCSRETVLLIKILNFVSGQDKFISHGNMHTFIPIYLKPKRTKVKLAVKLSPSTFVRSKRL